MDVTVVLAATKPGQNDDAGYLGLASDVYHPNWFVYVEVIENCTTVKCLQLIGQTVHRPRRMTVFPLVTHVTFELSSVADPGLLVEGQVLDYEKHAIGK
jgi:hypothetical protein